MTTKEQARLWVMNGVVGREWTVAEAAELIGVSERHTWRLLAAYREVGAAALAHGNRGHLPSNATPVGVQAQVISLARERYPGVNHTHFTELLAEREGIQLSRSTVRRLLTRVGLASPRRRSPPCHRYRRARMPQEGMLLQIDGSHHRWLGEDGPWLTLLLAVDDATSTVPYALFREEEDTEGYFRLMKGIIEPRGIPLGLYSDRHFIFCHSKPAGEAGEASQIDRYKLTQFGRAMRELGVTQVFAHSPEAKGRIERANGTFQDRLVAELRLAEARTIDEANAVLESFLPRFNDRFGVPAADPQPGYRPIGPGLDIDGVLCFKERRRVARDNTVQYHGHTLQIFPDADRRSYARVHAEVQARLDGRLLVYYQGKILTPQEAPPLAASLRAQANAKLEMELPAMPECPEPEEPQKDAAIHGPVHRIWYEDSEMKRMHRDLVKAGMEKARQQGKRIGRPRVTGRPGFPQQFAAIKERIGLGLLSRRQAAKQLSIGYATLKRCLDAEAEPADQRANQWLTLSTTHLRCDALAEVVD